MSLAVVSLGVSCPGIFSRFALISACLAATFRALALFSRILSLLKWKAWEQTVSNVSHLASLSSMSRAVALSALEAVTSSGSRLRTEVLPSPAPTPTSRPDS